MVKKSVIGNNIYDVYSFEDICHNPILKDSCTAIELQEGPYIYPIRNKTDNLPGAYDIGPMMVFKDPVTPSQCEAYSVDNVIDFSDSGNIRELMSKQAQLIDQERSILTTVDNVFSVDIGKNDAPPMVALKQAINAKNIDLEKYESRFGPNFNNDRRILRKDHISMDKLCMFLDKMDLAATLTIRDAHPDVPNPMGKEITVELIESSIAPTEE